jgi:hypothetical protein
MSQRAGSPALIIGSFAAALVLLVLVGLFAGTERDCIGDPISVAEPYERASIFAHSCLPQCDDKRPRYLVYGNGLATQCEAPPGCSDEGEDSGVTCRPPRRETTP